MSLSEVSLIIGLLYPLQLLTFVIQNPENMLSVHRPLETKSGTSPF